MKALRRVPRATEPNAESSKLSTFGGVFTPSLLTILGLVLFLRLGFVTGNVGLARMFLIVGLATAVSLITTISLAAIATNLRVGGGGVYFLVSRTLGPAFGGAIGLVLYLAMSVSIAFYAIGLGEAVTSAIGSTNTNLPRLIAAVTIVGLLGLAWLGADIATRLQYVVMACLTVALLAYLIGVVPAMSFAQLDANVGRPDGGDGFWIGFAIFFPAITGFTQGVAMSGDLRTPSQSITVGTFGAIAVSTVVYLIVILTFVMVVPLQALREDTAIMRQLSVSPLLIDIGVIAATLSSAIASILGAPRTLQRLAADRLVTPLNGFAVGAGPSNNPRRGALLSAVIALFTVAVGDLDVVAPIISMFFLASYGMINYATYSEARAASTSFRPRFRFFDWRLSLLGTVACLGAILAIDPLAGGLAGIAILVLYRYLSTSVEQVRFADSTRGYHASGVRSHLRQMSQHQDAGGDFRPCTIAFAPRDPQRRERLTHVASWLEGGAGFTTIARIVPGRGPIARKHATRVNLELQREIGELEVPVYGRAVVSQDLASGVAAMIQAHGLGAVLPNLALFSWYDPDDPERQNADDYAEMVQTCVRHDCNVGVVSAPDVGWDRLARAAYARPKISVWWSDDASGQLLTLLGWLFTRTDQWSNATLQVLVPGDIDGLSATHVADLLDNARLPADVESVVDSDAFVPSTAGADLVLAPLRLRKGVALGPGNVPVDRLAPQLPVVVFLHAAAPVTLDVQPDDSGSAALGEAQDRAMQATARAEELDLTASSLIVAAEVLRIEIEANGEDVDGQIAAATQAATQAKRAYLDARSRADEAWRLVREMDPSAATDRLDPNVWLEARPATERR